MQLSLFDLTNEVNNHDNLANTIIDEICSFVENELLSHCFQLKSKKVDFSIWSNVPYLGRNISVYYRFCHNWGRKGEGYKCVSEDDNLINDIIFDSKIYDKINGFKNGIECTFSILPGVIAIFVQGIDKPIRKTKIRDFEDE